MQGFQKIVLIIAIVILIVILIFIGYSLGNVTKESWPPLIGDCPDYWIDMSGNGAMCVNTKDLGNGKCLSLTDGESHQTVDFTTGVYTGSNSACAKYTWANTCGVSWDGITYGVTNPCDVSTTA